MSTHWIEVGMPTLDRPFGLALWPIFEKGYEALNGYKPQDFRFEQGKTALSTYAATASVLVSYYIVIFGGREIMRNRAPLQLNWLFKVHNLYLTIISGVLLGLFLEQLIPTIWRNGVFYAICNHEGGWTDKLVILYYVRPPFNLDWPLFGYLGQWLMIFPAQLFNKVSGIARHLLLVPQEEASQYVLRPCICNELR
jgi:fatty acid elongase 3